MSDLHRRLTVFDGLVVSNFDRAILQDMRDGGITAANCTCCVWEDFEATVRNVARFKKLIADNADLAMQVYSLADIAQAKAAGKVGIILGWQNTSGYGDDLDMVPLFAELGVRIVQLTYNTANAVGDGCYESVDRGLTDFGRDLVAALNRNGVLIDLSHVGPKSASDAIRASKRPVAYSHCAPAGLKRHPRNKSDAQIRAIVEAGGFIGVTMFPPFLARGAESTVEDYVDAIAYTINLAGETQVGIGTDMTQGQPAEFFRWITHDKGNGRKLVDFGATFELKGFSRLSEFPNLTAAMERRGWSEERIARILGGNWLRLLEAVWG
ncbi:MAG TPA: dipeptidase [Xanthobacteraceae bacterium]|nr:dipeptidase [Xanthobacteraceae bacterium]